MALVLMLFMLFGSVFGTQASMAGPISGGGGELLGNRQNPWFVENTEHVRYCIRSSPDFGLSHILVSKRVREAIDYWTTEFKANYKAQSRSAIKVGTQQFHEEVCNSKTDITFQLGVLTPEQRNDISGVDDFIAFAYRTEYSSRALIGKGIIYVASANAIAARDSRKIYVPEPWSIKDGLLLRNVLIHELEHVFGIPHIGNSSDWMNLTSSRYPETILEHKHAHNLALVELPRFFQIVETGESAVTCSDSGLPTKTARFLGISTKWKCLKLKYTPSKIHVFTLDDDRKENLIGTATLQPVPFSLSSTELVGDIWLSAERSVFRALPSGHHQLFFRPRALEKKGQYCSADRKTCRSVFLTLTDQPWSPRLGGVLDGELILNPQFGL